MWATKYTKYTSQEKMLPLLNKHFKHFRKYMERHFSHKIRIVEETRRFFILITQPLPLISFLIGYICFVIVKNKNYVDYKGTKIAPHLLIKRFKFKFLTHFHCFFTKIKITLNLFNLWSREATRDKFGPMFIFVAI